MSGTISSNLAAGTGYVPFGTACCSKNKSPLQQDIAASKKAAADSISATPEDKNTRDSLKDQDSVKNADKTAASIQQTLTEQASQEKLVRAAITSTSQDAVKDANTSGSHAAPPLVDSEISDSLQTQSPGSSTEKASAQREEPPVNRQNGAKQLQAAFSDQADNSQLGKYLDVLA